MMMKTTQSPSLSRDSNGAVSCSRQRFFNGAVIIGRLNSQAGRNTSLRVLHLDSGREMRGGQRQVLLLAQSLTEAGHINSLLVRKDSPLRKAAEKSGLAVGSINAKTVWLQGNSADVVHAHDARSHTLAALFVAKPLVVSRRVAFPIKRSPVSRWKYKKPARFLAVSEFVATQLKCAGIPTEKIDVVYDAVLPSELMGEWNPLYPAIALATADPGKGRDLVEQAARLAGIDVLFSDDLLRDLRKASMFVYISRSEGLGSAALLAMQLGIPVIASDTGGLREVVIDGKTGLLVKNDAAEIAHAMQRMRSDSKLAQTFIDRAMARVNADFSVDRMLERTLASYRRAGAG